MKIRPRRVLSVPEPELMQSHKKALSQSSPKKGFKSSSRQICLEYIFYSPSTFFPIWSEWKASCAAAQNDINFSIAADIKLKKGVFYCMRIYDFSGLHFVEFFSLFALSFKCQPCIEDSIKKILDDSDEGMRGSGFEEANQFILTSAKSEGFSEDSLDKIENVCINLCGIDWDLLRKNVCMSRNANER